MNYNLNETQKINYSLEDAFRIINSIINSEKEKYENIINIMNQKITELKLQIKELKEENTKYKNKIFHLQNHFVSFSNTISELNEMSDKQIINENNNNKILNNDDILKNKEVFNKMKKMSISMNSNDNNINIFNNSDLNNNKDYKLINNNINDNLNKNNFNNLNINYQQFKNSLNQQLFNKKLIRKINSFSQREKTGSKSFNFKNNIPIKIIKRNNEDDRNTDNNTGSINSLDVDLLKFRNKNNCILKNDRKLYDKNSMQSYSYKRQYNSQKDKYNKIERRIKNLKNGLSIYNSEKNKNFNEFGENYKIKFNNTFNGNSYNIHNI